MTENIIVGIAEYKISSNPNKLVTLGLGSCIGICIYDTELKIGGLSHIMLPNMPVNKENFNGSPSKYADTAIPLMVEELIKNGASHKNLVAKIVGGANMFENISNSNNLTIGYRNQLSVKETLENLNIPILKEDLGGNVGRSITLDLKDLKLTIRVRGKSFEL